MTPRRWRTRSERKKQNSQSFLRLRVKEIVVRSEHICIERRISAITHNVTNASASTLSPSGNDMESMRLFDSAAVAANSLEAISPGPVSRVVMTSVDPPPRGVVWSRLNTSLRAPREFEEDFFVPYFGESKEHMDTSVALARDLKNSTPTESAETCSETEVAQKALDAVRKSPLMEDIAEDIVEQMDESDAEEELSDHNAPDLELFVTGFWSRARKRVAVRDVAKAFPVAIWSSLVGHLAAVLNISEEAVLRYTSNVTYRENRWLLLEFEKRQKLEQGRQITRHLRETHRPPNCSVLESKSFKYFFCRQCYIYDCQMHDNDTAKPLVLPFDATRKENRSKEEQGENLKTCKWKSEGACYYMIHGVQVEGRGASPLSQSMITHKPDLASLVKELRDLYGNDFCRIASALPYIDSPALLVTCYDVGQYALNFCGPLAETGKEPISKKMRNRAFRSRETYSGEERPDFEACSHEGACTKKMGCICAEKGLLCEKSCGCNLARVCGDRVQSKSEVHCSRAFAGCNCTSGALCKSNACDCFVLNRECDPDLCTTCMDCSTGEDGHKQPKCHNCSIRLKEHYRLVVGRSEVHGWGVFSTALIPSGRLIGEYVGEIIVHDHAERRGRVYDKLDCSFLFATTQDVSVDSTRMGNKLRYCNHSFNPNCIAKLVRVSGDVRVGLYAIRNIRPFEELFFNYNYGEGGPAWARKSMKRSPKRARGRTMRNTVSRQPVNRSPGISSVEATWKNRSLSNDANAIKESAVGVDISASTLNSSGGDNCSALKSTNTRGMNLRSRPGHIKKHLRSYGELGAAAEVSPRGDTSSLSKGSQNKRPSSSDAFVVVNDESPSEYSRSS